MTLWNYYYNFNLPHGNPVLRNAKRVNGAENIKNGGTKSKRNIYTSSYIFKRVL